MKHNRTYFFLLILFTSTVVSIARSISIVGDIQDGFLKTAVPGVKVSLLDIDKNELIDSLRTSEILDSRGKGVTRYWTEVPAEKKSYWIRVGAPGYGEVLQKVTVSDTKKNEVAVSVVSILRTGPNTLEEVTVSATRIKMFYRGDTLVYDASAFKLPDGSMLDNLIRQLPGAELRADGEIFINGRKIDELMLGARSFMKGNKKVLMENLPYYTVNNLKVYERESDLSRALGYDDGQKSFVMDVNLKQAYRVGTIANIEGAFGTENRWLGRAFILGFTDRWRFTLTGNANNVNESRNIGESDHWTPSGLPTNMSTTRSVASEADYVSESGNVKNNLSADYRHLTSNTDMRQLRETFVDGMRPHSFTECNSRDKSYSIEVRDRFTLLKPFFMDIDGSYKRERHNGLSQSTFSQWGDTLTARMLSTELDRGTTTTALLSAGARTPINKRKKQDIGISLIAMHYDNKIESAARYLLTQNAAPDRVNNSNSVLNLVNQLKAGANYSQALGPKWGLRSSLDYTIRDTRAHDYLYHPDTLTMPSQLETIAAVSDSPNSYRYRYTKHTEQITVTLVNYLLKELLPGVNISSERLNVKLDIPLMQQRLDYCRGAIDTVASHNSLRVNPSLSYTQKFGKGNRQEIRASLSVTTYELDLVQTIGYRDDSRPLVVVQGNPELKARQTSTCTFDYYNHNGPGKQEINAGTRFDFEHRNIAQSMCYDAYTGVYTYSPVNVSGAFKWQNTLNFSRDLDSKRLWSVQSNTIATLHHSLDHTMLSGMAKSELNKVNTAIFGERAYVQFSKGSVNLRATGDIKWRRSTGKMRDFATLSVTDFQYGLSGRYTIPLLNTTVSADGTMYSRRGYGSSSLNTDDFVLNASLSQSIMNGKIIAKIEAFDLLHRLSQTRYEVNAQGRVETWYRSLPHYIMLHLAWHLNINPKK